MTGAVSTGGFALPARYRGRASVFAVAPSKGRDQPFGYHALNITTVRSTTTPKSVAAAHLARHRPAPSSRRTGPKNAVTVVSSSLLV